MGGVEVEVGVEFKTNAGVACRTVIPIHNSLHTFMYMRGSAAQVVLR